MSKNDFYILGRLIAELDPEIQKRVSTLQLSPIEKQAADNFIKQRNYIVSGTMPAGLTPEGLEYLWVLLGILKGLL